MQCITTAEQKHLDEQAEAAGTEAAGTEAAGTEAAAETKAETEASAHISLAA
jgi:hypothetical protein